MFENPLYNLIFKIFLILVVLGGFFAVLVGGVTGEEWHLYLAMAISVLLIGGILKSQQVIDAVKNRFLGGSKSPDA